MSRGAENMNIQATIAVSREKIDDLARNLLGADKLDRKWERDFPLVMKHLLIGDEVECVEPGIYQVYNARLGQPLKITFKAKPTTGIDRFNSIIKLVEKKIGA